MRLPLPDVLDAPDIAMTDWEFRTEFGSLENGCNLLANESIDHAMLVSSLRKHRLHVEAICGDVLAVVFDREDV